MVSAYEVILLEYFIEHVLQTVLRQELFKLESIKCYQVEFLQCAVEELRLHVIQINVR